MKIKLSGHHVDITDPVKQYVEEKFSKIASHFPTLISLDIIVAKEHGEYEVEIRTKFLPLVVTLSCTPHYQRQLKN